MLCRCHLHFLIVLALNLCFVSEACWGNRTQRRGSGSAHSWSCLLQSPQEGLSGPCSAPPLPLSTLLVSPALPHHCHPSIPKVVSGLRRQGPRPWCSVASWGEAWWQPPLPALGWQSSGLSTDDSAGGLSTTPELCTESMKVTISWGVHDVLWPQVHGKGSAFLTLVGAIFAFCTRPCKL